MKLNMLISSARKAIKDFEMIQSGDKIAIGLSGGKDSITLLHILKHYQRFSPTPFELIAITINPGNVDNTPLSHLCQAIDVPYYEIKSNINEILFDIRKEKNPCSLCAKLRRGMINEKAKLLGCNKIALGHHKDDALETLMMSIVQEGRFSCFQPITYMDKIDMTAIRPMIYIEEQDIKKHVRLAKYPIIKNPCPYDGHTTRQKMKELILSLTNENPNFKKNLFHALTNPQQVNLWQKIVSTK
ncbi:MAG: tRNA 2-thiocytidine biosynthesis TtcA family protein [Bacillaceae bacterium]